MEWSYRVSAFIDKEEPYFRIHEVYCDEKVKATAYMPRPAGVESESPDGMMRVMGQMKKAMEMPVLKVTDFPESSDRETALLPPPGYSNWLDYVAGNTSVPLDINIESFFRSVAVGT